jgi:class 3 adenylate cyclase
MVPIRPGWRVLKTGSRKANDMPAVNPLEDRILEIRNAFHPSDLNGPRAHIFKALDQFELDTGQQLNHPGLKAVVKWHKSLYLQRTKSFARSEELLDAALSRLDETTEPLFRRWRLKVFLSLGYNHRAQLNYLDAEFYLKEALKLSLTEPALNKFQGEIYSLLASINLSLNRYDLALKYVTTEREKVFGLFQSNPALGRIYGYALYDYCRVTRLIGAADPQIFKSLDDATGLFRKMNDSTGLLKARLERSQWQLIFKAYDKVLENAAWLEPQFSTAAMPQELLETGLLIVKTWMDMHDYEKAEMKLDELIGAAQNLEMQSTPIAADLLYTKGTIYAAYNLEREAFDHFRKAAKIGMALGLKGLIIRSYNAARVISPYPAREFITSDLVCQDALFFRDRLKKSITPYCAAKTKIKLFASTLFLDIVGFSRIMRKSSEDMTVTMIDELIDRLCLIIYQNGGYIDKFLGDGFMAIFEHGQRLNADCAFNAVRSGMDILRSLKHKNRKLIQVYGASHQIRIRMGLSSGEIYALVLGNYIKREYSYLGNSVNLAAKLESIAVKQPLLIDKKTFDLVKERVMAKKQITAIPDLGKMETYGILRLSRMGERGKVEEPPDMDAP